MIQDTAISLSLVLLTTVYSFKYLEKDMVMVTAYGTDRQFLVNNIKGKEMVANRIHDIQMTLDLLVSLLSQAVNEYPEQEIYIRRLIERFPRTLLIENPSLRPDKTLTSFSINKGDKIVFCVRDPDNILTVYDKNLLLYVALHEISHIACPIEGHGELFSKIFKFILQFAVLNGLYSHVDYLKSPEPYCGIVIRENLLK